MSMTATTNTEFKTMQLVREDIIVWGAGGHAKVMAEIIAQSDVWNVLGFIDDVDHERHHDCFFGHPVFSSLDAALAATQARHAFVAVGNNEARMRLIEMLMAKGLSVVTVLAPDCRISPTSKIGVGCAIMSGAVVNANAVIGAGVIVNTKAVVEHDCVLGKGVSVGPGAILCGTVTVNDHTFIGAGSVVRERIMIGQRCVIGCGASVVSDIEDDSLACGVPAKVARYLGPPENFPIPEHQQTSVTSKNQTQPENAIHIEHPNLGHSRLTETNFSRSLIASSSRTFAHPLHVGRPNIGDRDALMRRIGEILDRRWLTNDGVCVRELEARVCSITGARNCVAMCNATVALEIMIRACGLTGEVLVPSYTFVATAHALQWQAITPVFCDIDARTHTLDPGCLTRQITPRTTGIIGVHIWGRPCDVDGLQRVADDHGLTLLYDAAHAFGTAHRGQSLTRYGRASVLSFHATKFVNAFEGGAVVTDDDELAEKMRLMRNFGFAGEDRVVYVGTNGKMCEVSAAMGITSIEAMSEFVATNRDNYEAYREGLAELPGVGLLQYDFDDDQNYQYVVLDIDSDEAGLTRDELKQVLTRNNVLARRYFWPGCHRMEPYKSLYPNSHLWLPETERVASRVLVLPTGTAVTATDIAIICQIIADALKSPHDIRDTLTDSRTPVAADR